MINDEQLRKIARPGRLCLLVSPEHGAEVRRVNRVDSDGLWFNVLRTLGNSPDNATMACLPLDCAMLKQCLVRYPSPDMASICDSQGVEQFHYDFGIKLEEAQKLLDQQAKARNTDP